MEFLFRKEGKTIVGFDAEEGLEFNNLDELAEHIYDQYRDEVLDVKLSYNSYKYLKKTIKEIKKNLYVDNMEISEFLENGELFTKVDEELILEIVEFSETIDNAQNKDAYLAFCNHHKKVKTIGEFDEAFKGEYDGWKDFGLGIVEGCYNLNESLQPYFDFEEFGESHKDDGYYLLEEKYVFS